MGLNGSQAVALPPKRVAKVIEGRTVASQLEGPFYDWHLFHATGT